MADMQPESTPFDAAGIDALATRIVDMLQRASMLLDDAARTTDVKALMSNARVLHARLDERLQVVPPSHWPDVRRISDELEDGITWLEALAALLPTKTSSIA